MVVEGMTVGSRRTLSGHRSERVQARLVRCPRSTPYILRGRSLCFTDGHVTVRDQRNWVNTRQHPPNLGAYSNPRAPTLQEDS